MTISRRALLLGFAAAPVAAGPLASILFTRVSDMPGYEMWVGERGIDAVRFFDKNDRTIIEAVSPHPISDSWNRVAISYDGSGSPSGITFHKPVPMTTEEIAEMEAEIDAEWEEEWAERMAEEI